MKTAAQIGLLFLSIAFPVQGITIDKDLLVGLCAAACSADLAYRLIVQNAKLSWFVPAVQAIQQAQTGVKDELISLQKDVKDVQHELIILDERTRVVNEIFSRFDSTGLGTPGGSGSIDDQAQPIRKEITFADVAGLEEAKQELVDIINFLSDPDAFRRLGAKPPRGILLTGQPGNGKTLLAMSLVGELKKLSGKECNFWYANGSEFVEKYVGVGASRIRELFDRAREQTPCIIFIDEIDAIGSKRSYNDSGAEYTQTLDQLLTELDGFDTTDQSVIVIGATNRPEVLDKALLRPGRFDRQIDIPYPDKSAREEILRLHAQNVCFDEVDFEHVARVTVGFSGAELAGMVNQAAVFATRENKQLVTIDDIEQARDQLVLGSKRTLVISPEDLKETAYHEAGHAIVRLMLDNVSPLHKVTIVPRGHTLGVTWAISQEDKHSYTKADLFAEIMFAYGGYVAEELVFNHISSGASNDLEKLTFIAHQMICDFGMSEALPRAHFGGEFKLSGDFIERAIAEILESAYEQTRALLEEHRDMLDILADALLEHETLDANQIYELFPQVTNR